MPALVALNHLPGNGNLIYAGEMLKIPGAHSTSSTHMGTNYHTVVTGDTLYGIAARYHVKPMVIVHRNHLPRSLVVVLGERLAIPHRVTTRTGTQSTGTPAATSAAGADRALLAHRSEPSQTQVAAIIRSTAARWGLDPALALAVSWQESGWNMIRCRRSTRSARCRSCATPAPTSPTMSSTATSNLYDAHDNVTAGVALLSVLTNEASSTQRAVAGYYQGSAVGA